MDDLKLIKKYYGENMMHLCRTLFPTILETKGLLFSLLEREFAHTRHLYNDIIEYNLQDEFRDYIYSLLDENKEEVVVTEKSVKELLDEAGYVLYECKTEEDIQSFRKYYIKKEELCTFDGGRLERCYVFFAVKKDVDRIKRRNFLNPKRDDLYGTSVISIQFSRGDVNTLSIKNRYNHTVENPDATISNNLENIIPGLTKSFEREYGLNINQNGNSKINFLDFGYVKANDGKYYKFNYEINNIYYGPDNIIIDNFEVKRYEKEKYLILDYFMLDLVNKKIILYDNSLRDSFVDGLENIEKIEINNTDNGKIIKIVYDIDKEAIIEVDKQNRIISYKNDNLKEVGDDFLCESFYLQRISLENVNKIGDNFLQNNFAVKEMNLLNVVEIGNNFMESNNNVEIVNLPNLLIIGDAFFYGNTIIKEVNLPLITSIGNSFMYDNENLEKLDLSSVISIGNDFLSNNRILNMINISNVITIGDGFLQYNTELEELDIGKVTSIGYDFLLVNKKMKKINLSNNVLIEQGFLRDNINLFKLKMLLFLKSQIIKSNISKGRTR